jgi:hypothetical protein
LSIKDLWELDDTITVVSSAYKIGVIFSILVKAEGKLFTYKRNRSGPRVDP